MSGDKDGVVAVNVTGAVYGNAWDTVFVVPQPGVYALYLTTTSAVCTNTSTTVSITTGPMMASVSVASASA